MMLAFARAVAGFRSAAEGIAAEVENVSETRCAFGSCRCGCLSGRRAWGCAGDAGRGGGEKRGLFCAIGGAAAAGFANRPKRL